MFKFIHILLVALCATFSLPNSILACTCSPLNRPLVEYDQVDVVFMGVAAEVQESPNGRLEAKIIVTGIWKGIRSSVIRVLTGNPCMGCGFPFQEGQSYLIYALKVADFYGAKAIYTGICNRTRPISMAQEDFQALGEPQLVPVRNSTWGSIKALYVN